MSDREALPRIAVHRNAGHPWDNSPGWDLLFIHANSEKDLAGLVIQAETKFWQQWISGWTETPSGKQIPSAVLYKPSGAKAPWTDTP